MTTPQFRSSAVAAAVGLFVLTAPAAYARPPVRAGNLGRSSPLTVEEQRVALPVPQEILRRSGFHRFARRFAAVLGAVPGRAAAQSAVAAEGRLLWRFAVARAQGRTGPDALPPDDDRPLYWARLELAATLRRWQPRFAISPAERARLMDALHRSSRGQDTVGFPAGAARRLLITGFDPFRLDDDLRNGNPSGSAALALDGAVLATPAGPARVRAAMFPVLWGPFERGTLERTLLPHLLPGPRRADMVVTLSQGRPERFDLERWNGRWHTCADNNREPREGTVAIAAGTPTLLPAPEFVPTTLPYRRIVAGNPGPFPLFDHTEVVEIRAGGCEPEPAPGGPTPGSVARAGSGGGFLSNEIAYRATLLRDALGAGVPTGHLHVPALRFGTGDTAELTDPAFERSRLAIVSQARALLAVAAAALR